MNLVKVHTLIMKPFVEESVKALEKMAGLKAVPQKGEQRPVQDFRFNGYAVCLPTRLDNDPHGFVVMNYDKKLALTLGSKMHLWMLGTPPDPEHVWEDISELLTEYANTAIGLAIHRLHRAELNLSFSAPLFTTASRELEELISDVRDTLTIPINVEEVGPFEFVYMMYTPLE